MTMPDDNDDQHSTQNEETTFDGSTHSKLTSNQAELKSLSQVIDLSLYQADPYRPELDSSAFDVTRYLPPGVQAQFVERGGALFIPHRINEFAVKIVKRRVDLVCFQCCLRFTLGFNRPAAKLSHGFMARWTGLMPQNVRRGLLSLKEMGLIRVLVSPTNSTSTIYEVPIVRGYLDWKRQREDEARGSNQSEYTQRDGDYLNQLPQDNQLNYPGIISPITKKENSNKNTNLSLSDESLPHKIKAYIAGLKPHRKRVEEEYHLQQLMVDYPVDDIVESLDFVQTHGTLDTGEAVFMPFKYLCFAAEDVIAQIAKEKARIARAEELRVRLEQEQAEEEHRRTQDAKEMNDALAAFAALDTEERNRQVAQFRQTHYGSHGMEPPESITLNLAAKHWYQRKREQT